MTSIPATQFAVFADRLEGVQAELEVRLGLVDQSFDIKEKQAVASIELAGYKANDQIELNALGNVGRLDIATIDADAKSDIANLRGQNSVELATLNAELSLERENIIGPEMLRGKVNIERERNAIEVTLAEQAGEFKSEIADMEGGFSVELAKLDADGIISLSGVRIVGIQALSNVQMQATRDETIYKVATTQLTSSAEIQMEKTKRIADKSIIVLNGQNDDLLTIQDGTLDKLINTADTNLKIAYIGATTQQELQDGRDKTTLEVADIDLRKQESINDDINRESEEGIFNASSNMLELINIKAVSLEEVTSTTVTGADEVLSIEADRDARILHTQTMSTQELKATQADALIDIQGDQDVATEEQAIKQDAHDITNNAKLVDAGIKVQHILNLSTIRGATDLALANVKAAGDVATTAAVVTNIQAETATQIGEIQTSASADALNVIAMATVGANSVIALGQQAYSYAITEATANSTFQTAAITYMNDIATTTNGYITAYSAAEAFFNKDTTHHTETVIQSSGHPPAPSGISGMYLNLVSLPSPPKL